MLRIYETLGRSVTIELASGRGSFELFETDFEEREFEPVAGRSLSFRPFEIKTLKMVFTGN